MANKVYVTVCDALSLIISQRAAESIIRDALMFFGTDSDQVTAREMQDLLRGRVFARLQKIIPLTQARSEVKNLLVKLDEMMKVYSSLSPEILEGLDALRAEFVPFQDLTHTRAQTLKNGLATLEKASDPIKTLNTLWAELDMLQQELGFIGGITAPFEQLTNAPSENINHLISQENFDGVELNFPESKFETNQNDLIPHSTLQVNKVEISEKITISAEKKSIPISLKPASPRAQKLHLATPKQQELILARFALEEGVFGIALTDRRGNVVLARISEGELSHLAGVTAATALLLEKHKAFEVFYVNLITTSVFIISFSELLLTILADAQVNVGRILSEVKAIQEEL